MRQIKDPEKQLAGNKDPQKGRNGIYGIYLCNISADMRDTLFTYTDTDRQDHSGNNSYRQHYQEENSKFCNTVKWPGKRDAGKNSQQASCFKRQARIDEQLHIEGDRRNDEENKQNVSQPESAGNPCPDDKRTNPYPTDECSYHNGERAMCSTKEYQEIANPCNLQGHSGKS